MVREHKVPGLFSDRGSGFGQDREPELELALLIQRSEPGDPRLLDELVNRYAGKIFQLASALIDWETSGSPRDDRICALVEDTFSSAVSKSDKFWGESSIEDWLFRLTLQLYRNQLRWGTVKKWFGKRSSSRPHWKTAPRRTSSTSSIQNDINLGDQIDVLSVDERSTLILYYVFNREISEIARLLSKSEERIAGHLYSAWERILAGQNTQDSIRGDSHTWMQRRMQDHLIGRLNDDVYARETLQQHIDQCSACRDIYMEFKELDARLAERLAKRWSFLPVASHESHELAKAVRTQLHDSQPFKDLIHPIQKGSWIGVFVLVFVGIAWLVTRSGYLVEEINSIPGPPTPTPYPLPQPLEIPASAHAVDWQTAQRKAPDFVYNFDPVMSADGRYIAFTHREVVTTHDDSDSLPQVILHDRSEDQYIQITRPQEKRGGAKWRHNLITNRWTESQDAGQDWGYAPSISEDGRWIVFTSAEKLEDGDTNENCSQYLGESWGCPGVYLLDRESGETRRIDRAPNGEPGDNASFNPRISPDGQTVAYWSAANNLLASDPNPCLEEFNYRDRCIDLFIFERETGTQTIIPIGTQMEGAWYTSLDLSYEGDLLAIGIHANDRIADELELSNELEAFVYDLRMSQFHSLNISGDEVPGNGTSYGAAISADGRFAGFVSHASNLVSADTNEIADIFVRDLDSGHVERISLASDGRQGNFNLPNQDNRWLPAVDLSSDGRYVAFAFRENDLDGRPLGSCDLSSSNPCTSIYLYDRESGTTQRIASPHNERYLSTPGISADGRYVSYAEAMRNCSSESVHRTCGETWLYDQETEWTYAVSKGIFPSPASRALLEEPERIPEVSSDLIISPDGQLIATIYNAKNHRPMINLWTVEDRVHKSFLQVKDGETITAAAFSPNGQFIAAGLQDGTVDIWRLSDRRRGFRFKDQPGKILKLVFSEDSKRVLAGSTEALWIWELRDRTFFRIRAQDFPPGSASEVAFSPQGTHLALAANDGTIWIMNIASGEVISRLESIDESPRTMAFSPDGGKLAIGSEDGSLQIWQLEFRSRDRIDINYLKTLVHPAQVTMASFSPDGATLATIDLDGKLRLWNYITESILDSYPDDPWESVNTFALSLDGTTLASSSWTGPTHLFKLLNQVSQPHFFDRAQSDQLSLPLAFPPDPDSKNWQFPARSLYQANDILEADLKVPTYMPPGFVFGGARVVRLNSAAWLQYHYKDKPSGARAATLTIFQGPRAAEISDMPIGASAPVEKIKVSQSINSEIVKGDWVPIGRDFDNGSSREALVSMVWDSQAPSYRLRFQSGGRTISLYYEQAKDTESYTYINLADLVSIAESLVNLGQTDKPEPVLAHYTVKDGDTCTAIAERFGASLGDIVRQNDLTDNCGFIFSGQELTIPLGSERVTVAQKDLDCDGQVERVRIIPNPVSIDGNTVLGIVVEALSTLGYYHEAWRYTIADTQAYLLSYPQILNVDGCRKDLAVNLLMNALGETRNEIYRWQGNTMLPVNETEAANSLH